MYPHVFERADGKVVVTAMGTHAVLIHDFDKASVDTVGRNGGGPGEFALPGVIVPWSNARFAVLDEMLRRVSVISSAQRVDSIFAYPEIGVVPRVPNEAQDWIATGSTRIRDSIPLLRVAANGAHRDTLSYLAESKTQFIPVGDMAFNLPIGYAPRDVWGRLSDGRIWIARGADNRVDWIQSDGKSQRGVPHAFELIPTVAADQRRIDGLPAPTILDTVEREIAKQKAPFQDVVAASNGALWFWLNQPAGYTTELYEIRDPSDHVIARLRSPNGHQLVAVGAQFVYLFGENADGEFVLTRHRMPSRLQECCGITKSN